MSSVEKASSPEVEFMEGLFHAQAEFVKDLTTEQKNLLFNDLCKVYTDISKLQEQELDELIQNSKVKKLAEKAEDLKSKIVLWMVLQLKAGKRILLEKEQEAVRQKEKEATHAKMNEFVAEMIDENVNEMNELNNDENENVKNEFEVVDLETNEHFPINFLKPSYMAPDYTDHFTDEFVKLNVDGDFKNYFHVGKQLNIEKHKKMMERYKSTALLDDLTKVPVVNSTVEFMLSKNFAAKEAVKGLQTQCHRIKDICVINHYIMHDLQILKAMFAKGEPQEACADFVDSLLRNSFDLHHTVVHAAGQAGSELKQVILQANKLPSTAKKLKQDPESNLFSVEEEKVIDLDKKKKTFAQKNNNNRGSPSGYQNRRFRPFYQGGFAPSISRTSTNFKGTTNRLLPFTPSEGIFEAVEATTRDPVVGVSKAVRLDSPSTQEGCHVASTFDSVRPDTSPRQILLARHCTVGRKIPSSLSPSSVGETQALSSLRGIQLDYKRSRNQTFLPAEKQFKATSVGPYLPRETTRNDRSENTSSCGTKQEQCLPKALHVTQTWVSREANDSRWKSLDRPSPRREEKHQLCRPKDNCSHYPSRFVDVEFRSQGRLLPCADGMAQPEVVLRKPTRRYTCNVLSSPRSVIGSRDFSKDCSLASPKFEVQRGMDIRLSRRYTDCAQIKKNEHSVKRSIDKLACCSGLDLECKEISVHPYEKNRASGFCDKFNRWDDRIAPEKIQKIEGRVQEECVSCGIIKPNQTENVSIMDRNQGCPSPGTATQHSSLSKPDEEFSKRSEKLKSQLECICPSGPLSTTRSGKMDRVTEHKAYSSLECCGPRGQDHYRCQPHRLGCHSLRPTFQDPYVWILEEERSRSASKSTGMSGNVLCCPFISTMDLPRRIDCAGNGQHNKPLRYHEMGTSEGRSFPSSDKNATGFGPPPNYPIPSFPGRQKQYLGGRPVETEVPEERLDVGRLVCERSNPTVGPPEDGSVRQSEQRTMPSVYLRSPSTACLRDKLFHLELETTLPLLGQSTVRSYRGISVESCSGECPGDSLSPNMASSSLVESASSTDGGRTNDHPLSKTDLQTRTSRFGSVHGTSPFDVMIVRLCSL